MAAVLITAAKEEVYSLRLSSGLRPLKDPASVAAGESFRDRGENHSAPRSTCVTVEPLEHFLVASPDVLPLRHDF